MLHGWITVVVLLEDIRVGDVLDTSITVQTTPRLFENRFWFFSPVPAALPLGEFNLAVRFASGRAMQWRSSDEEFAPEVRELEGETEWRWTA